MDYQTLYTNLVETCKTLDRQKGDGLYETHHITPRCLGGTDDAINLVNLTPREHYLAHWLLYKIHFGKDKAKMAYAFFRMCSNNPNQTRNITSRQYDVAKQAMSETCRGENNPIFGTNPFNDDQIEEIRQRQTGESNSMYGKVPWNKGKKLAPHSEETRKKISVANLGKTHTLESRQKMSEATKGRSKSESHKHAISKSLRGKKQPSEVVEKRIAKLRGRKQEVVTCPHCGKQGGTAMYRWHFDNCKFLG